MDLQKLKNKIPLDKNIVLVADDIEKEFQRIFKDYDFIEAAGGIVRRRKRLLFIKRNGLWDIPKGKLEKNESIEEGAVREIEEECGIQFPVIKEKLGITYHTYRFKDRPTIKKTYWFSLDYEGLKITKPQLEEGITKVKWFKLSKIEKVKRKTYPSIIEVIDWFLIKHQL